MSMLTNNTEVIMKEYIKPEVKVISVTQSTPIAAGFELSFPGFGGDFWD